MRDRYGINGVRNTTTTLASAVDGLACSRIELDLKPPGPIFNPRGVCFLTLRLPLFQYEVPSAPEEGV
jgi:hypothetical protein